MLPRRKSNAVHLHVSLIVETSEEILCSTACYRPMMRSLLRELRARSTNALPFRRFTCVRVMADHGSSDQGEASPYSEAGAHR